MLHPSPVVTDLEQVASDTAIQPGALDDCLEWS